MRLGDVAGRIDLIIERDHRALSFGCGINTYADSVQQIARPIKILLGCISLSTDQDNEQLRVDRQVEPPRCFLQRVRAMGDDYPKNLWAGERRRSCIVDPNPADRLPYRRKARFDLFATSTRA